MNIGLISILLSFFCMTSTVFAQTPVTADASTPTFASSYNTGIQLFQKKDYEKSRDAFAKSLELDPHNSSALTNLALVQYKLNQKGLAIANLRKVLELDPEQPTAKAALKFSLTQLETKEIPHQIETYETIREQLLQPVSLNIYLSLTALFLFAAGWTLFSFFGKRKRQLIAEEALPSFPLIAFFLSLGFIAFTSLSALKMYDRTIVRGTIIEEKVTVQASPGENQVALFDLYTGFEVIVQKTEPDWIQVTYPGASTGWIKRSALLVTTHP